MIPLRIGRVTAAVFWRSISVLFLAAPSSVRSLGCCRVGGPSVRAPRHRRGNWVFRLLALAQMRSRLQPEYLRRDIASLPGIEHIAGHLRIPRVHAAIKLITKVIAQRL